MMHEIETLKAQALQSRELDKASLLNSLEVLGGSLYLQKSLYNSLEAYASLVTTYALGTTEPSETVLQDGVGAGSLTELLTVCAAGAVQRTRLKHRRGSGQFGKTTRFQLPDLSQIGGPLSLPSSSALTHVLLELMVNAAKHTPEDATINVSVCISGSECEITIENHASQVVRLKQPVADSDLPLCEFFGIRSEFCESLEYSVADVCEGCQSCTEMWWKSSLNKGMKRLSLGEGTGIGLGQLRTIVLRALAGHLDVTSRFVDGDKYPWLITARLRFPCADSGRER